MTERVVISTTNTDWDICYVGHTWVIPAETEANKKQCNRFPCATVAAHDMESGPAWARGSLAHRHPQVRPELSDPTTIRFVPIMFSVHWARCSLPAGSKGVGLVMGTAIGGLLAQPASTYPGAFSATGVFARCAPLLSSFA